ncbi:DNA-binding transcriptional regulator, MarR family [Ekhidna lutea]|uniref:DNA-binding transcriptional regulator, MarR family n=1 Tax=Ekhidna lutea TaxID=447679 RepID=A0A239ENG7_EKHLU|nr:MarR family transcriptional regulator [Ekhidna lutea]SNS46177.1 DNA-binding transcriptional regulator, MarR family [Ekhidna lutea]
MKREETVDYNIKALWHGVSRMYNQFGSPYDLTASTGFVLLNIDVENGTPATKIAPMLGMESRSLTRMLKSMEEKGWVYRKKDAIDGRSVRVFLSDIGKEKRELSRRAVREFNTKIRTLVDEKKLSVFFEVLQEIGGIVDDPSLFKKVADQIAEEFAADGLLQPNH